jgi:acyl-CoA thioesterase
MSSNVRDQTLVGDFSRSAKALAVNNQDDADELARSVARAMFANDRAAQAMGVELIEVREGFAAVAFIVRDDMLSGHAIAHGGFIFALADTAFAYACNSRNRATIALQCTISFSAPGKLGSRLTATARERFSGGRTGTYDVDVTDEAGATIAFFRGTSYGVAGTFV